MKYILALSLTLASLTGFAQTKTDFLIRRGLQETVANNPVIQSILSGIHATDCTSPVELEGATQRCTLMGSGNSCTFTFTMTCKTDDGNGLVNSEKFSGAAKFDERTKTLTVFQVMLDSFGDHQDWISFLKK